MRLIALWRLTDGGCIVWTRHNTSTYFFFPLSIPDICYLVHEKSVLLPKKGIPCHFLKNDCVLVAFVGVEKKARWRFRSKAEKYDLAFLRHHRRIITTSNHSLKVVLGTCPLKTISCVKEDWRDLHTLDMQ